MTQLLFCGFLLLSLGGLVVGAFFISTLVGIGAIILASAIAVPPLLGAFAHWDLLDAKSRYGLSDTELQAFIRLVPYLASQSEFANRAPRQAKRCAKQEAARRIIRDRPGGSGSSCHNTVD